ncbi:MAG: tRNA (guanosine(46)-N7)-methyltransferase TrmB [Deltaproteobacteria bacterium]|nr:tRNA (guanosine(46)-N7)-methyltransferase TrmB [Deltaproteobacteria bacterium]
MPVKHPNPFSYSTDGLSDQVNPYVAALRAANEDGSLALGFGRALEGSAGTWRQRVAAYYGKADGYKRLVIEIGCHLGKTLLEMAEANPDTLFIGFDITFKRVVTTAQRAKAKGLQNVFVVLANAAAIDQVFASGEVDGVVIFFPDPWVKKARQAKNRLVDASFCQRLEGVLVKDGFCWFKSDQRPYFDVVAAHLRERGFVRQATERPEVFPRDHISTFESRFSQKNIDTYGGWWKSGAIEMTH